MIRKILHLDLDAFFCSVEELHDPSLKGKAFAVGGKADRRGVVTSCSYAARQFGVRSAMPMSQALRLCPNLIIVSSHHGNYRQVSKQVMALIDISPLVEPISIDEAFVEVTDLPDSLESIAKKLQRRINTELKLPVSLGGGTNKLIAKIANDWGKKQKPGKQAPNAITIIPPGGEATFLAPLPVRALWGIGPKTAEKLAGIGINSIGDLARTPNETLKMVFGRFGPDLRTRAMGIDDRPIETDQIAKSISNEITFPQDLVDEKELLNHLLNLSEQVGGRLRKTSLAGTTIQIKLRWSDFSTITRQKTLPTPTNLDQEIFETASKLFLANRPSGKRVRLIGVGVTQLSPPVRQLNLWYNKNERNIKLTSAVDSIRERFGEDIIQPGRQVKPPLKHSPDEEETE